MGPTSPTQPPLPRGDGPLRARSCSRHLGLDLRELLYPPGEADGPTPRECSTTTFTQPAIFAVEYALAPLWMSWGVRPAALLGHSIGEYVAAVPGRGLHLEDALRLWSSGAR